LAAAWALLPKVWKIEELTVPGSTSTRMPPGRKDLPPKKLPQFITDHYL
jgi:hypothetical protein